MRAKNVHGLHRKLSKGRASALAAAVASLLAGIVQPVVAGAESDSGIVRDGIDTESLTREGIDTKSNTGEGLDTKTVKDGIDRSHDETGLTDEGIDREGLDDDVERPAKSD